MAEKAGSPEKQAGACDTDPGLLTADRKPMQNKESGSLETADHSDVKSTERWDHCNQFTDEGDGRTESLLTNEVFCSPKCAVRGGRV